MKPFKYLKASNLEEAIILLDKFKDDKRILAGGTDFVVKLKEDLVKENVFIDIKRVKELSYIKDDGDFLRIGSIVTHKEIIKSDLISLYAPILKKASSLIGGPQIRNMGTIGGNLGNASPSGDTISPLYVLDAHIVLQSIDGIRDILIQNFFLKPGLTSIRNNELIKEVYFKKMKEKEIGIFKKIGKRNAMSISVLNLAVILEKENDFINNIKIASGAVAPTVVKARKTEELLFAKKISKELVKFAKNTLKNEISPISDIRGSKEYRLISAANLLEEALMEIFGGILWY